MLITSRLARILLRPRLAVARKHLALGHRHGAGREQAGVHEVLALGCVVVRVVERAGVRLLSLLAREVVAAAGEGYQWG